MSKIKNRVDQSNDNGEPTKQPPRKPRPDIRVFESQLARMNLTVPPDPKTGQPGIFHTATLFVANPDGSDTWEEWHVVWRPGQEDAAVNAIGQWAGVPWFSLTGYQAKELARQVRLVEAGRKEKERREAAERAKEAKEARERATEQRKANSSDSVFRKWKDADGECEGK